MNQKIESPHQIISNEEEFFRRLNRSNVSIKIIDFVFVFIMKTIILVLKLFTFILIMILFLVGVFRSCYRFFRLCYVKIMIPFDFNQNKKMINFILDYMKIKKEIPKQI
jgi:hypothetical protein